MASINPTAASLLGFLLDGPKTGGELQKSMEASIGNFWNVTRSQIYRELKTLATLALIKAGTTGERDSVPFQITKAGRKVFSAWLAQTPANTVMRQPLVVSIFFGAQLEPGRLKELVSQGRKEHAAQLARYQELHPSVAEPFRRATLELGLIYELAWITWLDGLMETLQK